MKKYFTLKNISLFTSVLFTSSLIGYVLISNISPFGMRRTYVGFNSKEVSSLGPEDRVSLIKSGNDPMIKQSSDLAYFSVSSPIKYDTATLRLTFENNNFEQDIFVGYQDKEQWHYETKLIDSPVINSLGWNRTGTNPTLYQRGTTYKSYEKFLENPPNDDIVATYNYDPSLLINPRLKIESYSPSRKNLTINSPLRGKHTLYVYLQNEPFYMKITKQDLNWYDDPDAVSIDIYKDKDIVLTKTISDDGISDASGKVSPPQEIEIRNPGPELPENGVYKVVIDAPTDTIIKNITTNLHKIVFESPIFLAGNKNVYPIVEATSPTTLFTNALRISAETYHSAGIQTIKMSDDDLIINDTHTQAVSTASGKTEKITIANNDVLLKAVLGYFTFQEDSFFQPTQFKTIPITDPDDIQLSDYIIADYTPVEKRGNWKTTEVTYDISNAHVVDGKLSWMIKAPGIEENNGSMIIKSIEIELYKKPLPFIESLFNLWK